MNVRQIEAFRAVMMAGSVTRAGERLSISQPAVSQLLSQFERACGFKLFERQAGKFSPTREAQALFLEVERVYSGLGQISRTAAAIRDQRWGALSIAAFPAIARRLIPDILWNFLAERPDVECRIESMRSRSLIDAVATQHVDVGFSILPGDRSEVESTRLHRMRGLCIMPVGHRLASKASIEAHDLEDEDFVSLGPQDHSRFMVDRVFDEKKVRRRSRIEVGQSETAISLVAAGAGVAVIDPIVTYNMNDPRVIVRRFEPLVEFDVWLIRPKAALSSTLMNGFVEHALKALQGFADELAGHE
jgi:DNA-binding transcriptional LysR family regulator